jgi:hypothetical protein
LDAIVLDEGAEIQGHEAVLQWFARTAEEYGFHMEPKEHFDRATARSSRPS